MLCDRIKKYFVKALIAANGKEHGYKYGRQMGRDNISHG